MKIKRQNIRVVSGLVKSPFILITTICMVLVASLGLTGCINSIPDSNPEPTGIDTKVSLKAPKIDLYADTGAFSPGEMNVRLQTIVFNPNPTAIDLDNLKVTVKGDMGNNYEQATFPGGSIAPNSARIFTPVITVHTEVIVEEKLTITLGTNARAADATLPVSATTTINIGASDLQNLVTTPKIALLAKVTKLTSTGTGTQLEAEIEANFSNPNPLRLDISLFRIIVKGKQGNVLAFKNVDGGSTSPKSSSSFTTDMAIPTQALNEMPVTVNVEAMAGMARFSSQIKSTTVLQIPKLKELISVPQLTAEVETVWRATLPRISLQVMVLPTIKNDNYYALTIGDIKLRIYKPQDTQIYSNPTFMLATLIQGIQSGSTKTLSNWIYLDTEVVGPLGSDATFIIDTEVGIEGVNEKIPISTSVIVPLKGWGAP